MKSAFCSNPRTIELREIEKPAVPNDGVLMQVKACGICGSDLRRWKEGPPQGVGGIVPGHEAAGIVAEVGKNCHRFSVGDRIAIAPDIHCGTCWYCRRGLFNLCDALKFLGITPGYPGAFAEYVALDGHTLSNGIVNRMPDGLSFSHAALAEPACSVLATHEKLNNSLNQVIVVIGAGPIGCLHVVIGKARGAKMIVVQRSETRQKIAAQFEPEQIFSPLIHDVVACVRNATDGLGADVVICANPVAETQTQAVEMVRKGGRVVLFGGLPKANPIVPFDANKIHYGEITVAGDFSYHPRMHELALELLHQNTIPAERFITKTVTLDQIQEAFSVAAEGSQLKVMITMD